LSHENQNVAGAEAFASAEGNMCGSVMRGPDALPGSEATSRKKGPRRNPGDLTLPMAAQAVRGRDGKSRRRSRRGRGEESDGCVVPAKPRTKPISTSVAEMVEGGKAAGRGEGKQQRMPRRAWCGAAAKAVLRAPIVAGPNPEIDQLGGPPRQRRICPGRSKDIAISAAASVLTPPWPARCWRFDEFRAAASYEKDPYP
jgi:hypothetical protein